MIKFYLSFLLYLASAKDKPHDVIIKTDLGQVILDNNKRRAYMYADQTPDVYATNIENTLKIMNKHARVWSYRIEVVTPDSTYKYKRLPFKEPRVKGSKTKL